MSFVHLHNHTHYTFQKALATPERLAKRAKELGQTAIAITDAGNMYGAFEFYQACMSEGIKPIIGVEFLISKKGRKSRDKDNELFEIVLLAKNYQGYKNLIDLVTISQIEGYYNGRPRIDFELIEKFCNNTIALSGSLYGEISQMISTGKEESLICERIEYYRNTFGKENYFLEIEEHPDKSLQANINETIISLSKKYGYEYVGTNNAYYVAPDDAEVQDMMSSVSDGRSLDDPDRATLMNGDYSIRGSREMEELFVYAPKAYENTSKIADMIDLVIDYGSYKIPVFPLSEDEKIRYNKFIENIEQINVHSEKKYQSLISEEWLLRTMCIDGLNTRYEFGLTEKDKDVLLQKISVERPDKKLSSMTVEELYALAESYYSSEKNELLKNFTENQQSVIRRLEYELTVVELMGFNGYFCIVADFIRFGKNNGVPVGPGRGSAAGAILAYLSGITDIDPLRYGLLFERFLNPARVTMPDIDVDFSDEGRDRVLTYVRTKYGADRVAQVCTFGTLAARAAVKDSGKALGMPFSEMNEFAKLIPARPGITLSEALTEAIEFKTAYDTEDKYKKIVDAALKMEGTVRQLGVHACAVIIAPEPMTHFCPLQPPPKDPNSIVTQFSAGPLEALGLLKMDFLGLRNLSILDRARVIVREFHNVDVDLLKIDYENQEVLDLFGEGDMTGVFQFESSGMRRYLKELKPSSFEDLIAMVSLYRPGPLQYIPEFIDRKFGRKTVEYPHPSLEEILRPTYGIAVYQEQIMQLVQAFAGFSLGEADILRRAIGKKKYELLMEQRGKFIEAAHKQGHPEDLAIYIFDEIIEPFAGYGFNKSHAACYAMIAYQTAHMKTYYPTEFMTALMMSDEEDSDRIRLEIEEAREKEVKIMPPDVNESRKHFTFIDARTIRFGLKAIKGLGDGPIDTIRAALENGKFTDIYNFIERTGGDVINKKSLEALIQSGAMDAFGERASLMASIPKMSAYQKEIEAKKETSQMGMFDTGFEGGGASVHFELVRCEPMTFEERMKGEKAIIGYPVSGHPLDGIGEFIKKKSKNITAVYDWIEREPVAEEVRVLEEDMGVGEMKSNPPGAILTDASPSSDTPSGGDESSDDKDVSEAQQITPKKDKVEENIFAQLIGVVTNIRKIQTKTGGMMLVATVESVGFDFRIVVFPKDYEKYESKIQEDTIVVVEGRLKFDEESDEISIFPSAGWGKKSGQDTGSVKTFSISAFRSMAGIVNDAQLKDVPEAVDSITTDVEARYMIDIPSFWTKEDLLDLRAFLEGESSGLIQVWIRINGQIKYTKFSIENTANLENWIKVRGA